MKLALSHKSSSLKPSMDMDLYTNKSVPIRAPPSFSVCNSCHQQLGQTTDLSSSAVYTCKCCCRFYHKSCSPMKSSGTRGDICSSCIRRQVTDYELSYTHLATHQHMLPFEEIPNATNRLLNAATLDAQRRQSWVWRASPEEMEAQLEALKRMPSLGERLRRKQERSYSNPHVRITLPSESSDGDGCHTPTSLNVSSESLPQSSPKDFQSRNLSS